jgi:hypothetical protein
MTRNPLRILLQTTTPEKPDDWSIESFSLLRRELERCGRDGRPVVVTARNREVSASGSDPLGGSTGWIATSSGSSRSIRRGLTAARRGLDRLAGGGSCYDHRTTFAVLATASAWQTTSTVSPGGRRLAPRGRLRDGGDLLYTTGRRGPRGSGGRAGSRFARPEDPGRSSSSGPRGAVDARRGSSARVIAVGRSAARAALQSMSRSEGRANTRAPGRAVVHRAFHLPTTTEPPGAPSFVTEPEGTGMATNARAAADIRAYVRNLARWAAPVVADRRDESPKRYPPVRAPRDRQGLSSLP